MDQENAGASQTTGAEMYVLRLYVSGATPRSIAAIKNIKGICEASLKGHYELQVIDIYQQPELAQRAHVIAVPVLIKQLPKPLRHIVGELSDKERVLVGLDIIQKPAG